MASNGSGDIYGRMKLAERAIGKLERRPTGSGNGTSTTPLDNFIREADASFLAYPCTVDSVGHAAVRPTIGNGHIHAKYKKVANHYDVKVTMLIGSTTDLGDQFLRFDLPPEVTAIDPIGENNGILTMYNALQHWQGACVIHGELDGGTTPELRAITHQAQPLTVFVTAAVIYNGILGLTTSPAHGLGPGDSFTLDMNDNRFDGDYVVLRGSGTTLDVLVPGTLATGVTPGEMGWANNTPFSPNQGGILTPHGRQGIAGGALTGQSMPVGHFGGVPLPSAAAMVNGAYWVLTADFDVPGPVLVPGVNTPGGVKGDKGDPGADSTVPGPAGPAGQNFTANPFLNGTRMNVRSHSYPMSLRFNETPAGGSGASNTAHLWPYLLAQLTGMVPIVNSFGGTTADYITGSVLGGQNKTPWRPGVDYGIVIDQTIRNNIKYFGRSGGVEDPAGLALQAFTECLMSRARFYRAAPLNGNTGIRALQVGVGTTGPGWATVFPSVNNRGFYRGSEIYTTNPGDSIDIPFDGQELLLWGSRLTADHPSVGGDWEVHFPVGGPVIKTIPCWGGFPRNPGFGGQQDWYQHSTRLTTADAAFTTGTNTVRLTKKAGNAYPVYLNCVATPTIAVPRVLVVNDGDEYFPPGTIPSPVDTPAEMAQAYIDYRAAQTFVCALPEFAGYCKILDLVGWVPATMTDFRAPYVHPNDAGHQNIAANVDAALRAWITSFLPGVHNL